MGTSMLVPAVEEMPSGVLRAELPTPFPVGPVNCYLVLGRRPAVIDPGMIWKDSTDQLQGLLAEAGLVPSDIDAVIVTHGHPDHFGAAGWLADLADAPVVCGRPEVDKIRGAFGRATRSQLVRTLGLPEELRGAFTAFYDEVRTLTSSMDGQRVEPVDDLDALEVGDSTWTAHVTPGHAAGHLSLHQSETSLLVSGDHLLGTITPNPVLEPDDSAIDGRRRSLVEYLDTLARFADLDPAVVLPGHGPAFRAVPDLVAHTRSHHASRADDVLQLVASLGSPTPFEVAVAMFPHLDGFAHLLGVSEAIGHLDLLEDDGRIQRIDEAPIRYRAA